MAAKIFRINYKSDFILTMNSDAGWAIPFCIKFWTSVPSRAYFVGFDGTTYTHCAYDPSEPTKLVVQFDDHHLPIGDLNYQIAYHFTVADFPNDTEDEVINPAAITTEIDGETYHVMLDFTGETAPEIEFSLPAYANEAERIQNELQRQQNEQQRIAAELQREQSTAAAVEGAENVNAQLNGTTLTVTNRQGVSTSVNTKGEQGVPGPVGPEGPQGEQGVSIVDFRPVYASETATYYVITFSDGHEQSVAIPKGAKGDTGATGPTGPQGPQGQTGVSITGLVKTGETETATLYNIAFSNGTTQQVAIPKGEKGDQGPVGPTGPQGPMGDVAVITPEQQAAFTMYSETGQNTNGPMTQKAVTDSLAEERMDMYEEFGEEKLISPAEMTSQNRVISESSLKWASYRDMSCKLMTVEDDYKFIKITANTSHDAAIGFLKQDGTVPNQAVFSDENPTFPIIIPASESQTFKIPSDCNLVYFYATDNHGNVFIPQQVKVLLNKVNNSFEPYTFEQGSIALDGVTMLESSITIRTGFFAIDKATTIKLKDGYRIFRLFAYNPDKTLKVVMIQSGTSNTQSLENTTLWYKMVVAKNDSSAITPDDDCVDLTINEKLHEDLFDSPSRYVFVAAYNSPARDQKRADYVCTGTNDELVIQQAINDQRIRYGGTLQLLDGTYYIDSFPNTDSDGNHVAILFGGYDYDNARVLDVTGTTRNKGCNSEWGVSIHVTPSAIAAMNDSDTYVIFKGTNTRPSLYPDYTFINTVNFYKMNIYIGEAEKKMVGIDMTYFGASFLEDIQVWTESYNAKRMNHEKPLTPVIGSIGVKTMNGSNDMCRVRWSFVTCCGMHKGFVIRSVDHLIMMNCAACRCVYGFYFENGTPKATLTLINCIDEGCVHLPYFRGSGHITALSFAVERFDYRYYPDDPDGNTEFYAQEATPGNWIGTIEYTIQGWSSANGTTLIGADQHFWKNGQGKKIRTRNLNSDHTGYSQPNAGEYLERYFDTTTNTWKTWNGSAWV